MTKEQSKHKAAHIKIVTMERTTQQKGKQEPTWQIQQREIEWKQEEFNDSY